MDTRLQDLADRAVKYAEQSGAQYCDVRAEQQERKSALIEKNSVEYVRINDDRGIGIRIIKDNVWKFCSITNPETFKQIKNTIDNAIKINKNDKKNKIKLYPNPAKKSQVDYLVIKKT